jgi:hypothetical protein
VFRLLLSSFVFDIFYCTWRKQVQIFIWNIDDRFSCLLDLKLRLWMVFLMILLFYGLICILFSYYRGLFVLFTLEFSHLCLLKQLFRTKNACRLIVLFLLTLFYRSLTRLLWAFSRRRRYILRAAYNKGFCAIWLLNLHRLARFGLFRISFPNSLKGQRLAFFSQFQLSFIFGFYLKRSLFGYMERRFKLSIRLWSNKPFYISWWGILL